MLIKCQRRIDKTLSYTKIFMWIYAFISSGKYWWLKLLSCNCLKTVEHSDKKLQLSPLCIYHHLHILPTDFPCFPAMIQHNREIRDTHATEMWDSSSGWVWLQVSWSHLSWNCTRIQYSFYQSFLPSPCVSDLYHGLKTIHTFSGSYPLWFRGAFSNKFLASLNPVMTSAS